MPAALLRVPCTVLTYFLSFAFMMAGLNKLVPQMPMYGHLVEEAPAWLRALRLDQVGLDATTLRLGIGAAEFACGLLLIATPLAAYGLAFIMVGALYTHFVLDGGKLTPEARPAGMLLAFILVLLSLQAPLKAAIEREKAEKEEGKTE